MAGRFTWLRCATTDNLSNWIVAAMFLMIFAWAEAYKRDIVSDQMGAAVRTTAACFVLFNFSHRIFLGDGFRFHRDRRQR
jgi:Flp pilus assembly protein protease CpaA